MGKIFIIGHKNPDTDSIVSVFGAEEYFKTVLKMDAVARRAGKINNETKFILEKIGVAVPEMIGGLAMDDTIALLDHNETSQVFDGLDFSCVTHIIDHHKLLIKTEKPIFCRMEVIGSTSSLIAKMFFEKNVMPSEKTAKLLMAGALSDTLNLLGPTTTDEDRELVRKLNDIAKIDISKFASEMFAAKSSLEGISMEEMISGDKKDYNMGQSKVGLATWETTLPDPVNEKKEEIMQTLKKKKEVEQLDYLFFMVVDILKQNCQLYIIGEPEKALAEKVFKGVVVDGIMELPGVVSRKKQIIPPLTEELAK